jgi:hypothetical protein
MGIPPQVAAIETSGRYFAKSSRFLKNLLSPWEPKQAPVSKMSLYLLIVKEAIQKQLFSCAVLASPTRSVVLKVAELLAEFQQFSTQKLL